VLLVGSGGREHALAWKLTQSHLLDTLYVIPGNAGTMINVSIPAEKLEQLADFAEKNACLTIVGPEGPLCAGIVDFFRSRGLRIFGPTKDQARLESSKSYAKQVMKSCGILSAEFGTFTDYAAAIDYASSIDGHVVVKADGLAKGKGVFLCSNQREAERSIRSLLLENALGEAGKNVVIEQMLEGYEVSLMALCDGRNAIPFGTATDYKRVFDDNVGPNTGGMGACSPALSFDKREEESAMEQIVRPVVQKTGFQGFLYAGLMISKGETYVLEFNARLGDPETQAIVPRMDFDLMQVISEAESSGAISDLCLKFSNNCACCVVMCSRGYPGEISIGQTITGLDAKLEHSMIFHSGTKSNGDRVVTNGGRVLSVTGIGENLTLASEAAYESVKRISWEGEHHRTDIGKLTRSSDYSQSITRAVAS
jgi:phosphoribosylamine---glycine ligase